MKKYTFKISQKDFLFILAVKARRTTEKKYDYSDLDNGCGEIGEKIIRQFLTLRGWHVIESIRTYVNKSEYIKFDIRAIKNGVEKRFEVKTDIYISPGEETGNLFIEVECRGHKSGIEATESDFFITVLFFKREIWIADSKTLHQLIQDNQDVFRLVPGGERDKKTGEKITKGRLIPRNRYREYFEVIEFGLDVVNKNFKDVNEPQGVIG